MRARASLGGVKPPSLSYNYIHCINSTPDIRVLRVGYQYNHYCKSSTGLFQRLDTLHCMYQVTTLQDRIKALEDDNKLLTHSLSDKNAQIKLHTNQLNVRASAAVQVVTMFCGLLYRRQRENAINWLLVISS